MQLENDMKQTNFGTGIPPAVATNAVMGLATWEGGATTVMMGMCGTPVMAESSVANGAAR